MGRGPNSTFNGVADRMAFDLAALGVVRQPPTSDSEVFEDFEHELARWETNDLVGGLHDLVESQLAPWPPQNERVLSQCPYATRLHTAEGWATVGRRPKRPPTTIVLARWDGSEATVFDITDTEPVNARETQPTSRDRAAAHCIEQLTTVAEASNVAVYPGGVRGRPSDATRRAMQRVVNGALLDSPNGASVLADASYTDASGRRRVRRFIATHAELEASREAKALALELARATVSTHQTAAGGEVEAAVIAEALCRDFGIETRGEMLQRVVLLASSGNSFDPREVLARRRHSILGHLRRLRALIRARG